MQHLERTIAINSCRTGEMNLMSGTESAPLAGDVMEPLPARLALHHSVAAARELMWAAGLSYLVVVAPVTGKLLGIALRRVLEKGCESRGHDPEACPLVRHLSTDFDFVFEGEPLDEIFGDAPITLAKPEEGRPSPETRRRNAIPVIVVDEWKMPIGLLKRPRGKVMLTGRGAGDDWDSDEDLPPDEN
jgi:CBS domain-containing protein